MKNSGWYYLHIQLYTEHVVQLLSRVWLFAIPWNAAHQASQSLSTSWSLLTHVYWIGDAIQPSHPLSSPPTAFYLSLASGSFPVSWLFASGNQSVGASASASVPMNIWGWFPLYWLVWSPCCPRDSQESSPAPQFKSINSLALSLLYSPPLTSIHDYTHTKYQ